MKILHLIQNYYPSIGGSQVVFQCVSENLVHLYHDDVTVFTTNALYDPPSPTNIFIPLGVEHIEGVDVYRFPFNQYFSKIYRYVLRLSSKLNFPIPFRSFFDTLHAGPVSWKMFHAVRSWQGDVIASTPANYLNSFYPLLWQANPKVPCVIYGALHLQNRSVSPSVLWAIRHARAYVAYTSFERDHLVQAGVDSKKIHVIGAGVNLEDFASGDGTRVRQQFGIGNAPIIMFMGRHAAYKGVDTLLLAMRDVWKSFPEAYVLIAGSETPFTEILRRMAAEFSREEQAHMIFLGQVSEQDKANCLAACNVFVSVSSEESFGIVYLEAWASQKPVIGGRIGAVQSLIREGVDGLLTSCGNTAELAESILMLLSNPKLSHQMGTNGFERVKQEYTWKIVTGKLRSVYESVL